MRRLSAVFVWLAFAGWLAACAALPPLAVADDGPRVRAVSVVSNGWHTAIVVPRPALAETGLLPEADDFPEAAYLEFGWGDRVYYPAKEKTLGMALTAALTPTPAVMHIAGRAGVPVRSDETEVLPVKLTDAGFRGLVQAIADEFKRPAGGRAAPVSPGLYRDSKFYEAEGSFHLFNTCNTWSARMLRAGGLDLSPSGVVTADDLMARLRAIREKH